MASQVSPGVYVQERDFSDYVASLSTTMVGMVGTARSGPINVPMFVSSTADFLAKFGEPDVNQYGALAALSFLRRGSQLWYVRVARQYDVGRAILDSVGSPEADGRVYSVTLEAGHDIAVGNFVRISQSGRATSADLQVTNVTGNVVTFGSPLLDSYDSGDSSDSSVDVSSASAASSAEAFGFGRYHGEVQRLIHFKARNPGDFANFGSRLGIEVVIEDGGQFQNLDPQGQIITDEGGIPLQGVMPSAPSVDNKFDLISLSTSDGVIVGQTRGVNRDSAVARVTAVADNSGNLAVTVSSSAGIAVGDDVELSGTSSYDGTHEVVSVPNATTIVLAYSDPITPGVETGFAEGSGYHAFGTVYRCASVNSEGSVWTPVGVLTKRVKVLYKGSQVEVFDNLIGYSPVSTNFWETVIGTEANPVSQYITCEYLGESGEQPVNTFQRTSHPNNPRVLLGFDAAVRITNSDTAPVETFYNAKGYNGNTPSASDYIGIVSETGAATGLQHFRNTELYDINVLCVPGVSLSSVIQELFSVLDARHDAFGVIDPPLGLTFQEALDWHNGTGNYTGLHQPFATDKAAAYWPWVQIHDPYTGRDLWMPPTAFVPGVFAYNDSVGQVWFAPAGEQRGKIPNALAVEHQLTQGQRDLMYGPGNGNGLNPVVQFSRSGIMVYGQRTLQRTATALDRIQVRRMLFAIEKVVSASCRRLNFEQNDPILWDHFISLVEPTLRRCRQLRALEWYELVCDESTNTPERRNNNEGGAKIYLIPTKAAEKWILDFTLLASGANVTEFIQQDINGSTVSLR